MHKGNGSNLVSTQKRLIACGAALLVTAVFLFLDRFYIYSLLHFFLMHKTAEVIADNVPNLTGLLGAAVLLFSYLRSEPEEKAAPDTGRQGDEILTDSDTMFSLSERNRVLSPEEILDLVNDPTKQEILSDRQIIERRFQDIQWRARREIDDLSKRSNVNLVFGVAVTVIGIGVLLYLVNHQPEYSTLPAVLSHYLPRITTVALIEAFAYFFLNLYKANLEEIKYYQNERTSATAWQIAWIAAQGEEKTKTASFVIQQLAQQDRNGKVLAKPAESKDGSGTIDLVSLLKVIAKLSGDSKGEKKEE